jgi:hypothetical protein
MGSLTITYQPPGQRPLSVATVQDEGLLRQTAILALAQAEQHAAEIGAEDPIMGRLHAAEVERLRTTLAILIPGFLDAIEGILQ